MSKISTKFDSIKTLYNNNLWQGRLILATLITLLILVIVRVSLPYTIIYSAVYWLNKQGITAQIEDITININKGEFSIHGASGKKGETRVFNIGKASIDWEWTPLSNKTIHITDVTLEDFNLRAAQYQDAIEIAGIVIREGETVEQQPTDEAGPVAWGASLNQIDFHDLGFCFQQFDSPFDQAKKENNLLDYCADIEKLTWQGDFSLGNADLPDQSPEDRLAVDGTLQIKQLRLFNNRLEGALANIGSTSFSDIKINGINDIRLDSINIAELTLLQRSGHLKHRHAVEFSKLDISDISLSKLDNLTLKSIELTKPVISMGKDKSGKYRYEQWLLQQAPAGTKPAQVPDEKTVAGNAFNIKLGNIKITDSEVCYEQQASDTSKQSQALDYCLNLTSSEWRGDLAITTPVDTKPLSLTLKGSLALSGFITTNNLLNRDLLSFDNLEINNIAVNNPDDLAFGKLDLDNLAGLELTSTEDKHTVTVAGLDVSTFSYRNNTLSIDKAAINDLGLEITQNKDGSLDFEQWKFSTGAQQASAEAESETETSKPDTAPVKIKVGEFSLDTTRLVEFADLSVTPNMLIGLRELHFDIKELDSEKPEHKSPIELSATTTRHGTITIKGVAMPFETKPSFDASGKITGLDLRVASPKAEQAIGHIIKSGQLDADLKLLSVDGQLDSNIALVLHHFKLKAKSKEDAAALDETFGMPINQSLMLLKDKKDRIKLDIPITGDINNPEFDPTDAIIKATAKATTVTLITFYTPYGLAYAGGNVLFNIATAMNFDPVIFDAGSSQLTDAHMGQLSKLAELLTERPAVHLTLCGFTNLNDREKLFTEIIDRKQIKPPSADYLQKLIQLGSERQENVKNHLISVGKIEHNRLILCAPEHSDDADAIGGVEISI